MIEHKFLRHALSASALTFATAFAMACAGASPTVLTSTPEDVAIEFPKSGDLADASKLAAEECAKNGLIPRFVVVKMAATPTTRVAKFKCVSPDVAAPAETEAPAAAAAGAAADAAPTATDAPADATETPAADADATATPEASAPAEGAATP